VHFCGKTTAIVFVKATVRIYGILLIFKLSSCAQLLHGAALTTCTSLHGAHCVLAALLLFVV
jgi:hypothetical protein